jgi:subtilisin-like proprotein convertase family protein
MGYRFLLFFILLFFESQIYGQSCFIENFNLPDGNVRSVPLVLSGSNFNLTQDQICKINIRLKHESINQLRIRLISPGGQSLELLGPATALSNTIFPSPTYNLTFVRCTETPDPEPGYDARWRNDQVWIGSTFSGTYHPHTGCLDDFNVGPINGTWQLEIQDVARFDEGNIECFSIEFCNSTVVSASCDDRKGRILLPNATICEYDSLRLVPITDFPSGRPSLSSYTSRYVVLSGTELISYTTDTLKNLEPGNYSVCHFMVANDDISRLPQIGSLISNANFSQEFARLNLCGSVSDVCMNLTVNPVPAIIVDSSLKICRGSSLNFKNQVITNAGNYTIYVPSTTAGICDTLYQISVEEINLSPIISSNTNILPCSGQLVLSNASMNTSVNALFNFKGPGIVLTTPNSITINKIGIYTMIVSDQGCIDSTNLEIIGDPNLPTLSFFADTITCSNPSATITINTTGQRIVATNWSRGSSLNDSTVVTNQNGRLIATVTHADGCVISDSLIVAIDTVKIKPIFQLSEPNLTCSFRNITTTLQNGNLFEQNLTFTRNGSTISNISDISQAGSYVVFGQLIRNGCTDSTLITINDLQEVPSVSLETFCDNNNVFKIRAVIQRIPSVIRWTVPSGQTADPTSIEQIITTSGSFSFSYTSDAGCSSIDTTISVDLAQAFPSFEVEDDSLGCDRRNINLNVNLIDPNATYTWIGPNSFTSTNPTPIVNTVGIYSGEARYNNGCFTRDAAEIKLKTDETPFNLTSVINVLCEDTLKLQPVDKSRYTYTWRTDISPEILENVNDTLYTINPGVYILEISQGN